MKANVDRTLKNQEKERLLREHDEKPGSDCILVSVDFSRGQDTSVMIVGRRNAKGVVEIANAFQGKEAEELYFKLLGTNGSEFKTIVESLRAEIEEDNHES